MRILLKFDLSLEAGNEAVCSGKIAELNHSLMERIQPEAAYYSTENGKRISYIFFDLKDPSQLPAIAEPLFQDLRCSHPVYSGDERRRSTKWPCWAGGFISAPVRTGPSLLEDAFAGNAVDFIDWTGLTSSYFDLKK